MWQHMFSMPAMFTVWRRELDSRLHTVGSLKVFYTREVQGVEMWLTTIPSTYFMCLYLAQFDISCGLHISIATDMTVVLRW